MWSCAGAGPMKLDDEIVELEEWDAVRVAPGSGRGCEPGPRASRSSLSARPISAKRRMKTSRGSATGGLASASSASRPKRYFSAAPQAMAAWHG